MVLNGLKNLYNDICQCQRTYTTFVFAKNRINIDVLFDIKNSLFKLMLINRNSKVILHLDIQNDFTVEIYLENNEYKKLVEILELKFEKGNPFSTKTFFEEFNSKIPNKCNSKPINHTLARIAYNLEEEDKVEYDGFIDWEKFPELNKHYTNQNREKTRLLYPEIYNKIKDKNISVRYK